MPGMFARLSTLWSSQDLARRFLLASAAIVISSMTVIGMWISTRIAESVIHNVATSTALYFESVVAPMIQELATQPSMSARNEAQLNDLMTKTALGQRVFSFKIWLPNGAIAYASRPELRHKTYPPTPRRRRAWQGQVAAGLDLDEPENEGERAHGVPSLEIYVPIRDRNSARIIAVAEFYEHADTIVDDIFRAKLEAWAIVASIGFLALLALYVIVRGGSRTIDDQAKALRQRITQLSSLLEQNDQLRDRIARSSRRVSEVNERQMRRLGAELHDGPAQLIGLALLRLDAAVKGFGGRPDDRAARQLATNGNGAPTCEQRSLLVARNSDRVDRDVDIVRSALEDALAEIRTISYGLSVPHLERSTMTQTLEAAVRAHVERTETNVVSDISISEEATSLSVKITAFRFVQEALNNAARHAGAKGQTLRASVEDDRFVIEVSDGGPGFDPTSTFDTDRLGLAGMKDRIESIGGALEIEAVEGRGARLRARLPVQADGGNFHG